MWGDGGAVATMGLRKRGHRHCDASCYSKCLANSRHLIDDGNNDDDNDDSSEDGNEMFSQILAWLMKKS